MAAQGLTNRELAQALFVTVKTVEQHLGNVFAKLNVASRADAVRAARSAGALADAQPEGPSPAN